MDVLALLRLFLFENTRFDADHRVLNTVIDNLNDVDQPTTEYEQRLLRSIGGSAWPHPGVRWCLDLLPYAPRAAMDVIFAYTQAHFGVLPDGRLDGLLDARSIIRERWLGSTPDSRHSLFELSPRDLERVAAALYAKLGYQVHLIPPSRDGGRDVVARRTDQGAVTWC